VNKLARTIWDAITSRSLAVWLLIVVTVMLAAGAMLPNPALLAPSEAGDIQYRHPWIYSLGERFNSQELAKSRTFAFVGFFLIVSTALCSIDRLFSRYRSGAHRKAGPFPGTEGVSRTFDIAEKAILKDFSLTWLRKRGWRVAVSDEDDLTAVVGKRGEAGFWGSIFFHGILITALVGLLVYYFAGYRARLLFTEGQAYPLQEDRFYHVDKRPAWGFRLPDVEIGLLKQLSFYSPDARQSATDYVAKFRVTERAAGKSWEKDVRVNDPLVIDGKEFLLVVGGYSPRIMIRDKTGATIFDNYVTLRKREGTEDSIALGEGGLRIEARLFPDFTLANDSPSTKSLQLKNPFLHLTVSKGATVIGEGLIPYNGVLKIGTNMFVFQDVRRWVEMELVGEPGIGFFFMLLLLGVVGIAVRMLDPDELFQVVFRRDGVSVYMTVTASSVHFPGLMAGNANEFINAIEKKILRGQSK
jgi:hypothetical protein